jgi:membrane protein
LPAPSHHSAAELKSQVTHLGVNIGAAAREQVGIFLRSGRILVRTVRAFADDNGGRLSAALAFYSTVAIAPLLVLAIAVAGIVFNQADARQRIISEIVELAGSQTGAAVAAMQSPRATRTGTVATILGIGTLIFGGMGVFTHLQTALNAIWRVHPHKDPNWWHFVRRRLFSLAAVFATGILLLTSLTASAVLSWLGGQIAPQVGFSPLALHAMNVGISFFVVTFLFGMIFKLLPDRQVPWRHVWLGAAVTAVLFSVGKALLGLYLAEANLTSAYGAAGSLLVLLLWCYYSSQIVFLGAEFTRVTLLSDGGRNFTPLSAAGEGRLHF